MSKNRTYKVDKKIKHTSKIIEGGYVSSLTGVNQSERAELFKEQRRGTGIYENKKRKSQLKSKHRKAAYHYDSYSSPVSFFILDNKVYD